MYKKSNGPKLITEGPPVLQFPRQKNNPEYYLCFNFTLCFVLLILILLYLLTATGLTPGGSSTVHIYTQTIHRTTQLAT
jgi:hypothetical protein